MTLMEGSTLASSSIAMIAVVNDASEPPYSAGISIPINYPSTVIPLRTYALFKQSLDQSRIHNFCFVLQ